MLGPCHQGGNKFATLKVIVADCGSMSQSSHPILNDDNNGMSNDGDNDPKAHYKAKETWELGKLIGLYANE